MHLRLKIGRLGEKEDHRWLYCVKKRNRKREPLSNMLPIVYEERSVLHSKVGKIIIFLEMCGIDKHIVLMTQFASQLIHLPSTQPKEKQTT